MRAEIRSLQKAFAITALYVTHDQEEALSVSDRVALMQGGRFMQVGTPEEVYFFAAQRFRRRLYRRRVPRDPGGTRELLRPDQITVAEDGPLVGTLVSRAFLGASTDWIIDWQGQTLRASMPSAAELAREIGGEVRFAILPSRDHDE